MKWLVMLLIIGVAAYFGYMHFFAESDAVKAYKLFADAVAQEQAAGLRQYSGNDDVLSAVQYANTEGMQRNIYHGSEVTIESEAPSADGTGVDIVAVLTIAFDPPGLTSGMGGTWRSRYRQWVTLQEIDGAWKVVSFESEYLDSTEAGKR